MNYLAFRDRFHEVGICSIRDIRKSFGDFDTRRLVEWQHKGYIKKIINRWYLFSDIEVDEQLRFRIANSIYHPSYVSLESALAYYHLIPEGVFATTSISSNKTKTFKTCEGTFIYRRMKPGLFFGYKIVEWKGFPIKIASIEKTLLDYLYLNTGINTVAAIEGMRLHTDSLKEQLNKDQFDHYLAVFNNKEMMKRSHLLIQYLGL